MSKAEDQYCHCRKFLQPNRPQNRWKGHFISTVCFPAALCSDNLPRCPTFLIAGSFNHSTRKWISEMWWRLMAPFIACLTSHVLPKCVNPPHPHHENRAPLLMRCDVGWIYLKKLSSNRSCLCCCLCCLCCDRARGQLRRTLTVPCPTRHGLCHHVTPPHAGQTHTQMMTWPDYVPHMWFPWGGGLWELGRTRVAGEGQQTVSYSRPWWEMLGVRWRVAPKSGFFLDVCTANANILC